MTLAYPNNQVKPPRTILRRPGSQGAGMAGRMLKGLVRDIGFLEHPMGGELGTFDRANNQITSVFGTSGGIDVVAVGPAMATAGGTGSHTHDYEACSLSGPYTFSCVLATDVTPSAVLGGNDGADGYGLFIDFATIYHRPTGGTWASIAHGGISTNTMYTLTVTRDENDDILFYKNGELITGTITNSNISSVFEPNTITGYQNNRQFQLDGMVAQQLIWERCLTPQEVRWHHYNRFNHYVDEAALEIQAIGGYFVLNTLGTFEAALQDIEEKSALAWDDRAGEKFFYSHNNAGQCTIQRMTREGVNDGSSFTMPAGVGSNDVESICFLGAAGFTYDDGTSERTFHWAFLEEGEGSAPNDHPRIYLLEDMDNTTTSLDAADFATIELDDVTTEASYGAEGLAFDRATDKFYIVVQKVDSEGALWEITVPDSPTTPTQTKIIDLDVYSDAGLIDSGAFAGDLEIGNSDMGSSEGNLFILFNDGQNSADGDSGRKILEVTKEGVYLSTFVHSIEWQCEGLAFTDDLGDGTVDMGLVLEASAGGLENTMPTFWLYSPRAVNVLPWLSSGKKSDDDTDQYVPATPFYDDAFDDSSWDSFTGPGGDATVAQMRDTWHEDFGSTFNTALSINNRRTVYVTYEFEVTQAQIDACDEVVHRHITDAGCKVWLNGNEAFEYNTPVTIAHANRALAAVGGREEGNKHQHTSSKSNLVAGTNRMAIMHFNEGGADICCEHRVDLRADPAGGSTPKTPPDDASGGVVEALVIAVDVPVADASGGVSESPVISATIAITDASGGVSEVLSTLVKIAIADASGAPGEVLAALVKIPVVDASGGVIEGQTINVFLPLADASGGVVEALPIAGSFGLADASGGVTEQINVNAAGSSISVTDASGAPVEALAIHVTAAVGDSSGAPVETTGEGVFAPVADTSGTPLEAPTITASVPMADLSGAPVEQLAMRVLAVMTDVAGAPLEAVTVQAGVALVDASGGVTESLVITATVAIAEASGGVTEDTNVSTSGNEKTVTDQSGGTTESPIISVTLATTDASGAPVETLLVRVPITVADASGSPTEALALLGRVPVGDASGTPTEDVNIGAIGLQLSDASGSPVEVLSIAVTLALADQSGSPQEVANGVDTASRIFNVQFESPVAPTSGFGSMTAPGADFS